jgi:hypothetical protein
VSYVLKVRRSSKYSPRPHLLPEEDYLKVSPPTDQASELLDVMLAQSLGFEHRLRSEDDVVQMTLALRAFGGDVNARFAVLFK